MPLHLNNMDSVFTNDIVATEDTAVAEIIESVSKGAAVGSTSNIDFALYPVPLATTTGFIAVVEGIAYVPQEFGTLKSMLAKHSLGTLNSI